MSHFKPHTAVGETSDFSELQGEKTNPSFIFSNVSPPVSASVTPPH